MKSQKNMIWKGPMKFFNTKKKKKVYLYYLCSALRLMVRFLDCLVAGLDNPCELFLTWDIL